MAVPMNRSPTKRATRMGRMADLRISGTCLRLSAALPREDSRLSFSGVALRARNPGRPLCCQCSSVACFRISRRRSRGLGPNCWRNRAAVSFILCSLLLLGSLTNWDSIAPCRGRLEDSLRLRSVDLRKSAVIAQLLPRSSVLFASSLPLSGPWVSVRDNPVL